MASGSKGKKAFIMGTNPPNTIKCVSKENAILEAHDLEMARFSDRNEMFSSGTSSSMITTDTNLVKESENMFGHGWQLGHVVRKLDEGKENVAYELSQSVLSFEQGTKLTASGMNFIHRKSWEIPTVSEDGAERINCMMDPQDLEVGVTSKTNNNLLVYVEGPNGPKKANDLHGVSQTRSNKDFCPSLNQKYTSIVQIYENFKKNTHHLSLSKVSVGTSSVKAQFSCQEVFAEKSSFQSVRKNRLRASKKADFPLMIDTGPDCFDTSCEEHGCGNACYTDGIGIHLNYEMNDSGHASMPDFDYDCFDSFVSIPVVMAEEVSEVILPDSAHPFGSYVSRIRQFHAGEKQSGHGDLCSQLNEGINETCASSSPTHVTHATQKIDMAHMGPSNWCSEGKRISRSLNFSRSSNNFVDGASQFATSLMDGTHSDNDNDTYYETPPLSTSGRIVKWVSVSDIMGSTPIAVSPTFSSRRSEKQGFASGKEHSPSIRAVNKFRKSTLYSRNHGPFAGEVSVSTVSPQELLPYDQISAPTFSEYPILGPARAISTDSTLYDVKLNVQADDQSPHMPLVSVFSRWKNKAVVGYPVTVDVMGNCCSCSPPNRKDLKPKTSSINWLLKYSRGGVGELRPKTEYSADLHSGTKGKVSWHSMASSHLSESPCRKKSGYLPRKIRKLSSITVEYRYKEEERKLDVEYIRRPYISCVPLRLAFSRLNEALKS